MAPKRPASTFLTTPASGPIAHLFQDIEAFTADARALLIHNIVFIEYDDRYNVLTVAVPSSVFNHDLLFSFGDDVLKYQHNDDVFKFPWAWEELRAVIPADHVAIKMKCAASILSELTSVMYPATSHPGQLMSLFVVISTYAPFGAIKVPGISLKIAHADFIGKRDDNYLVAALENTPNTAKCSFGLENTNVSGGNGPYRGYDSRNYNAKN